MAQLRTHALSSPTKIAARLLKGDETDTLSYEVLDRRSANLAQHLVREGLSVGDPVAILLGNSLRYFEVAWGARRAGLYYVPISTHLTNAETEYIIADSGAKTLFIAAALLPKIGEMPSPLREKLKVIVIDDPQTGALAPGYAEIVDSGSALPKLPKLPERPIGIDLAYSSGTTGRPKGIKQPIAGAEIAKVHAADWLSFFNLSPEAVYLSPAPLYHAAPLRFCMRSIISGGTALVMDRFDAEGALRAIERYRVTHSQWVPTMFGRMLALPEEVRASYDLSSMQRVLHAAAPCPPDVKLRMIRWWGAIVWEYYAGSERNGATVISPQEWMEHQGSVGRAVSGELRIVDEGGRVCGPREEGVVYFANGPRFAYHNDPEKTAAAYNEQGWSTIGDIGYLDEDGYLHLTDRRANMIISGGVNIYPQEAENVLLTHEQVADAAVFGIPHADFGEQVVAVVRLESDVTPSAALADELVEFCRARLSHIKCPRLIDFARELPRTETGKLLKRVVRDRYRQALAARDEIPASSSPGTSEFWRLAGSDGRRTWESPREPTLERR